MIYYLLFKKVFQKAGQRMCGMSQDFIEKGAKILDLGCGSGIIGEKFQEYFGAKVLGVDIVDKRIAPLPFQKLERKDLPFEDDSFDIVLISYVLHHTLDPIFLLKEAKRVARRIIIFEDLPEGIFSKLYCKIHHFSYKIFFKDQGHGEFKSEKEWKKIFESLGLKILAQKKFYNFFAQKILFVLEK